MYVWSKRLAIGLLSGFGILVIVFFVQGASAETSMLKMHTTYWLALNYAGMVIWVFVWMIDQATMRQKNVWLWLVPFVFAPVPILMLFVLFLQRKMKA